MRLSKLSVVVTSPRIPGGALTPAAWRIVEAADTVAAPDLDAPVARALLSAGVTVRLLPASTAADLLGLAADATVVWLAGGEDDERLTTSLAENVVRRAESGQPGPDVEVVVGSFDPVGARLLDAVDVMDVLRRECPWDQQQTHTSLLPYLVEETYEVVEAVEAGTPGELRDELGDVLLQVLFHARVAADAGSAGFTIDDVAATLVDKLVRRHPHVFADVTVADAAGVEANWDAIKRAERSEASATERAPLGVRAFRRRAHVAMLAVRATEARALPPNTDRRG